MRLNENDWQEFYRAFPGAEGWIARRELTNELTHLRDWHKRGLLNEWQKKRLAELEQWNRNEV